VGPGRGDRPYHADRTAYPAMNLRLPASGSLLESLLNRPGAALVAYARGDLGWRGALGWAQM